MASASGHYVRDKQSGQVLHVRITRTGIEGVRDQTLFDQAQVAAAHVRMSKAISSGIFPEHPELKKQLASLSAAAGSAPGLEDVEGDLGPDGPPSPRDTTPSVTITDGPVDDLGHTPLTGPEGDTDDEGSSDEDAPPSELKVGADSADGAALGSAKSAGPARKIPKPSPTTVAKSDGASRPFFKNVEDPRMAAATRARIVREAVVNYNDSVPLAIPGRVVLLFAVCLWPAIAVFSILYQRANFHAPGFLFALFWSRPPAHLPMWERAYCMVLSRHCWQPPLTELIISHVLIWLAIYALYYAVSSSLGLGFGVLIRQAGYQGESVAVVETDDDRRITMYCAAGTAETPKALMTTVALYQGYHWLGQPLSARGKFWGWGKSLSDERPFGTWRLLEVDLTAIDKMCETPSSDSSHQDVFSRMVRVSARSREGTTQPAGSTFGSASIDSVIGSIAVAALVRSRSLREALAVFRGGAGSQ